MRRIFLLTLLAAGASNAPAMAQALPPVPAVPPPTNDTSVLRPAPVPTVPPERIAPADRAGSRTSRDAGPPNSTPFSSTPGGQSSGGLSGPSDHTRGVIPNLSK